MTSTSGTTHHKRLRLALFGAGRIGAVHAKNIAAHTCAELAWVVDPCPGAAAALAASYGGAPATAPDQVFDDVALDAVLIASPTPTHIDLLYRAQSTGLPAFCEKPVGLDLAAASALAATLTASSAPIMVGFHRRFDPSFAAIWDRVRSGEIGVVEQLIVVSRDPAPPPPSYVGLSGGIFRDCSIHDLDLARLFVPSIVSVHATGSNLFCDYIEQAGDFDSATITACGAAGELVTIVNSPPVRVRVRPAPGGVRQRRHAHRRQRDAHHGAQLRRREHGGGRRVPAVLPGALRKRVRRRAGLLHRLRGRRHPANAKFWRRARCSRAGRRRAAFRAHRPNRVPDTRGFVTTAGPGVPGTVPPMTSPDHHADALVSAHAELTALATLLDRWRAGALTDVDAATLATFATFVTLLNRWPAGALTDVDATTQLGRKNAKLSRECWCDHGVCCYAPIHPAAMHVAPHRHCILRLHGEQPVVAQAT